MIRRGEVYWVDFRGGVGAEIRKRRPAVVISDDDHNAHMSTVTVAPLSSALGPLRPHEVFVPAQALPVGRAGRVKTHQLRAVDKARLGRRMGVFPVGLMGVVEGSLRRHLGL